MGQELKDRIYSAVDHAFEATRRLHILYWLYDWLRSKEAAL